MVERISRRRFLHCSLVPLVAPYLLRRSAGRPSDEILTPFVQDAERRRAERLETDPEYGYAVDPELNAGRYNFVLYGYGDTHEPPFTERAEIGSFTILSYDRVGGLFTKTSLTHDLWAPEIWRYLTANGIDHDGGAIKIYRAFHDGSFDLMGQVIEHATGLCADFRFALRDEAIARGIDSILEYITVDVPFDLDVLPYYLDGQKHGIDYPDNHFAKGPQRMGGARAIQFIKTIPIEPEGSYDKQLEHHVREGYVFRALRASMRDNLRNPLFLPRAVLFWQQEEGRGTAQADFDVKQLLLDNPMVLAGAVGSVIRNGLDSAGLPEIAKEIYIVDPASGDGGVQWASSNAALPNPIIRGHIRSGRIPNGGHDLEVPFGRTVDPDAEDLVTHYWAPVRRRVKELLLA